MRPLAHSVLYPRAGSVEASPKAISGRTSYFRVRLAFHPYPHLIARLFNDGAFGPPRSLTSASPWTWVDHSVSGLRHATGRCKPPNALFRLAFASAPHVLLNLASACNSPVHSSIGTPSHMYSASTACRHTVSGSVSLPSRGAFHLSLTVLLLYRSPGSI